MNGQKSLKSSNIVKIEVESQLSSASTMARLVGRLATDWALSHHISNPQDSAKLYKLAQLNYPGEGRSQITASISQMGNTQLCHGSAKLRLGYNQKLKNQWKDCPNI